MQPSPPLSTAPPPTTGQRREILRLAVPAFGALIAEPLFLLADSAIVGHLGVAELAGVGLASAVLHTAVGLMVFLAYSTTPAVARAIGNGQLAKALAAGRDGIWLALLLGLVLAVAGFLAAGPLLDLMGADGEVHAFAVDYLRGSMPGLVAMLLIFAGTRQVQQRPGGQESRDRKDESEQERQPDAVASGGEGLGQLAVADGPRHCRRRGVREEHHQSDCRVQDRRCQPDAGQFGHAEVAHNGRIREQEQRLGDQRAEGRHCQAQDLAALPGGLRGGGGQLRGRLHGLTLAGPTHRPSSTFS